MSSDKLCRNFGSGSCPPNFVVWKIVFVLGDVFGSKNDRTMIWHHFRGVIFLIESKKFTHLAGDWAAAILIAPGGYLNAGPFCVGAFDLQMCCPRGGLSTRGGYPPDSTVTLSRIWRDFNMSGIRRRYPTRSFIRNRRTTQLTVTLGKSHVQIWKHLLPLTVFLLDQIPSPLTEVLESGFGFWRHLGYWLLDGEMMDFGHRRTHLFLVLTRETTNAK